MSAPVRALVVGAGADNVATAVTALAVGERLELDGHVVELREPIPSGHKLALREIASGQLVMKYGEPIGRAVADIAPEPTSTSTTSSAPVSPDRTTASAMPAERLGFRRASGPAGARDRVLVLPSVVCAGLVAERLDDGSVAVAVPHQHGCLQLGDDLVHSPDVLAGLGANPNVAATLVVSLGCETLHGRRLADEIAARGRPVELVTIQSVGGTAAATAAGRAIVERLHVEHGGAREPAPSSDLLLGLDAGDEALADLVAAEAARRGIGVARAGSSRGPEVHPELAAAGAQVIVSLVPEEQAPVGFALCPVVAVAAGGELHAALVTEFDVVPGGPEDAALASEVVDRVERAFDGEPTCAERRGSREFVLRRLAMTL